ncbi:MAG TPA: 2-amino-4-hydroxy-6-hydroxymethyldihydropteridine diphosphokinase [Polyangiaceae bacterium]|nr:2-amino-4-hydroxy-6-hydroxymethyldihydropteridine diphosphokinase [Polyangiaceae bacterium]
MSDDLRQYVIGLGANLGDRLATLRSALAALARYGSVVAVSDVYESAAVGPPQPDYLNAAVLLESALAPALLLEVLLGIERDHGRERRERWGPRTLDLDLLYSPDLVVRTPELALPHPELTRRAFALRPLLDVAPSAQDPSSKALYTELLPALEGQALRRFETSSNWCAGRAE